MVAITIRFQPFGSASLLQSGRGR